jgi:BASS family bile acid:Na+ symporter
VWVVSITVIIGRTSSYLLDNNQGGKIEAILAAISAVLCLLQFVIGYRLGKRYGEAEAASQLLGQKNTILVVWMSQTFLNPISSVAPTAYIVWQNIANSYQIYHHDKVKKAYGKED